MTMFLRGIANEDGKTEKSIESEKQDIARSSQGNGTSASAQRLSRVIGKVMENELNKKDVTFPRRVSFSFPDQLKLF